MAKPQKPKTLDEVSEDLGTALNLLLEWVRTPFFESRSEWEAWVTDYGARVGEFLDKYSWALGPAQHGVQPTADHASASNSTQAEHQVGRGG